MIHSRNMGMQKWWDNLVTESKNEGSKFNEKGRKWLIKVSDWS